MESRLSGRVILLTGGSSGIGKVTALRLAKEGARLVLLGGRSPEKLAAAGRQIRDLGADCLCIPGDLTDPRTADAGIEKAAEVFGGIDILINNAGSTFSCPFEQVTEAQFDEIMLLDVKVPYFLTQKVLPYLRKSDYAAIVNIASVVGHSGYPLQSAYSMAKHAMLGFSKSLARDLYRENIRVHVISPGGVFTEMVKKTRPDLTGDNMILPEDVAEVIAFLLLNRGNAVIDEILLHRMNKEPFSV